jgi:hypothetical protein
MIQTFEIAFFFPEGSTVSPLIGPARSWESLRWDQTLSNDDSDIQVEVLAPGGDVLRGPFETPSQVDLSGIDAQEYPYLKLRATLADASQLGTPQLDAWYVGYQPIAELALDSYALHLIPDTLEEGTPLEVEARVYSLNGALAPLAVLDFYLTNAANERALLRTDTLYDISAEARSSLTLETSDLLGQNQLLLTVRQPDTQEATTFDNAAVVPFFVQRDATPPTFEVLINGEAFPNDPNPVINLQDPALPFVAHNPTIEILAQDDNAALALQDDTTVVTVTLDERPIPYSVLAAGKGKADNELFLRFQPDFTGPDTTHTLVVTVEDVTGNRAADSPYQLHFRTQSELAVENIYPYPNPMSASTVFAFRLRGRDALLVEEFRLRIYTVTGRLVREFDLVEDGMSLEAGALRIGWNKLRWDGRDADGDLVGTGVYLYRVFARAEGDELDMGTTSRIEKVVVLR